MADLNEVRLIGRLTRDPELRSTPSGQMVCSFGLATGRRYKQNNEMKEETTFVDITLWGRQAETTAQYMKKGSLCYIGGRLKMDTWQDKQTGQKRSRMQVVGENVQFLEPRQYREDNQSVGTQRPAQNRVYEEDIEDLPPF